MSRIPYKLSCDICEKTLSICVKVVRNPPSMNHSVATDRNPLLNVHAWFPIAFRGGGQFATPIWGLALYASKSHDQL